MIDETHEDLLRRYAADLLLDHCEHLEFLNVVEGADAENGFPHGISQEDAERVHDLTGKATIRVSWPDHEYVYGNTFEDESHADDVAHDRG